MQAGDDTDKCQFKGTGQEREAGRVKQEDSFHHPLELPLNRGEHQYLTLRDLSSHDQDGEEGKVGRDEAAVPKGPLPI